MITEYFGEEKSKIALFRQVSILIRRKKHNKNSKICEIRGMRMRLKNYITKTKRRFEKIFILPRNGSAPKERRSLVVSNLCS